MAPAAVTVHRRPAQGVATSGRGSEKITLLALCLAGGITIGWLQPQPRVWPWLAIAGLTVVGAGLVHRRSRRWALALIAVGTVSFGAGWLTAHHHYRARDDLAASLVDHAALVRVDGEALGPPVVRHRSAGSMGAFDYRPPGTYFPMRIEALQSRAGTVRPARGKVLLRVEQTVAPFHAGDQVHATGMLYRFAPPLNPGEFDYQRYARSLGQAGVLTVEQPDLLTVAPARRSSVHGTLLRWRNALRRRAGGWLLADLPDTERTKRDALLSALLLGQRGPQLQDRDRSTHWAELAEPFQRVGLAHLLAISGLHLGILAGFVLLLVRLGGQYHRWHGWLVIVVVLLYLGLIEVRMPVMRAGVMTIAASLGLAFGRRMRVSGLLALSAIVLLLWRPDQLFTPGFQLSYCVVLGLLHLAPVLRRRWFGPRNMLASSAAEMVGQWLRTSVTVATTAWLIATPIQMYHFGTVSPLAVPLTVIALPIVAVLLAVGYVKMVLGVVLPSAALLLGVPLAICADGLIAIVDGVDAIPGSTVAVPNPPAVLSVLAVAWVCGLIMHHSRRQRGLLGLAAVVMATWFLWPTVSVKHSAAMRIDMLAVGDGSCFVLRSGGNTVVFDAGSGTDLDAGRRVIVPAMRRMGVRSINAVLISHPNFDHYSAVLEIVDEFDVRQVLVTPQFFERAEAEPLDPPAFLLDGLTRRRVAVAEVAAGEVRQFGDSRWTWLHPGGQAQYKRTNDGSMVVQIEVAGRRVLLCGDVQRTAMEILLDRNGPLAADVVELPHHGSHHELAETFIRRVNPQVALQSTGWTRWQRTRSAWEQALPGAERLITARDGACFVQINHTGAIRTGRFREAVNATPSDALP